MSSLLFVLIVAAIACTALSAAAWHAAGDERRRSDARVAALASAIAGAHMAADEAEVPVRVSHLFAAGTASSPTRLRLVAAGGILAAATIVAMVIGAGGHRSPASASAVSAMPIELVALGHERAGATLTVHGIVRNPPADTMTMDRLSAVVTAFDAAGRLVATSEAPLDAKTLAPGEEGRFVVSVGDASGVGRYRVSFRRGGQVIGHVDRRS